MVHRVSSCHYLNYEPYGEVQCDETQGTQYVKEHLFVASLDLKKIVSDYYSQHQEDQVSNEEAVDRT
jgi:hypothetical protein